MPFFHGVDIFTDGTEVNGEQNCRWLGPESKQWHETETVVLVYCHAPIVKKLEIHE